MLVYILNYFELDIILIIFTSVFLGGIIKGTVGIGLSMFAVPIIAFFLPPTTSMILLCVPVLVTNILQIEVQKGINSYRFLPMFMALVVGILIGVNLILEINHSSISKIIAISIIFAAIFNLFGLIPWDPPSFLMIGALPCLMGVTMYLQQKLNPQPTDPMQAKMFMFLPLIFTLLLARFPAGLVIYWAWNNLLSIIQQKIIMVKMGVK